MVWRLGAKKSDFAMGKGTFFAWQHDARSHNRRSALASDSTVPRRGFETALPVARSSGYTAVVALDRAGKPLGRSATIPI